MRGRHDRPTPLRVLQTRNVLGALAMALALTLPACGGGDGTQSDAKNKASATDHNEADVAFASSMIQHHAQALQMVNLTLGRTLDPKVEQLAEDIRAAQSPEVETMAGWLQDWGEDIPDTVLDHAHGGQDMDDMQNMEEVPGMMTGDDMKALEDAPDKHFQTMWLQAMTEHHEGAVEMARTEQEHGLFKPAIDLAGTIAKSQTAEIQTMGQLVSN